MDVLLLLHSQQTKVNTMSIQNIMLMEAELKLAQTPATTATRGERAMLIREIRSLDAQQPVTESSLKDVHELGKFIFGNLK